MAKEGLPTFGLEKLAGSFLDLAVGLGALALSVSIFKNVLRPRNKKEEKKKK